LLLVAREPIAHGILKQNPRDYGRRDTPLASRPLNLRQRINLDPRRNRRTPRLGLVHVNLSANTSRAMSLLFAIVATHRP
jgi:hypothetical protein